MVTWVLIAACVAMWIAELLVPGFFDRVDLSPWSGRREPWRFLTSAFAHSTSVTHIAFNMLALWSVGRFLEPALGRARYLALYLLSAFAGGVAYVVLSPGSAVHDPYATSVVGASGAVFGLFGALVPLYRRVGAPMGQLWVLLGINAAISFGVPGIAWQSHLGGLLAGLAVGQVFVSNNSTVRARTWPLFGALAVGLMVLLVARYALA